MDLLLGFFLIVIAGFYAGSETALYNANWIRLTNWVKRSLPGARTALNILNNQEVTIITTIVGTNFASVFATIFFEHYFVTQLGSAATPIAVLSTTTLLLIFGDYLPKGLAQTLPTAWLKNSATILNYSRFAFAPFTYLLSLIFPKSVRTALSRQDFLKAIAQHQEKSLTANMVARLFQFSKMKVKEAGIPIERIKSLPEDAPITEAIALLRKFGYSRIPVYKDKKTNIIGVLLAKDLISHPSSSTPISSLMRPVGRISEENRAIDVLRKMQHKGEHLTVLENHGGEVTGIVTLEDLIEELIGEIRSED